MLDHDTAVTTTAACTTARHPLCKSVVYTLTRGLDAPLQPCTCSCHAPDPIQDDELDDLLDREADRRLDQVLTDELFGAEL